jgi:hypothetical protein
MQLCRIEVLKIIFIYMDNILIKIGPETSIGARFPIVYNDNNQKIIDAINGIETHIENIRTVQTKRILPVLQYNETKYQQMKVSYDDLKDNYDELLSKYNEFSQKYDALLNAFNQIDDRIEEIIETGLVVPTNISAFENDAGYITSTEVPTAQVNADWEATSGAGQILHKPTLFSGNYNDLENKPTIPTVPTNVSAFTNDANYITSADVPAQVNADWNATSGAGQILNKPELFSGNYNDLENKPTIPTVPTAVSAFENDVNYLTSETDPTVPDWAKAENKPTYSYSEIANRPTNVSSFTNDANYITNTVNDLLYYYKKTDTYSTSEINALVGSITHFSWEIYANISSITNPSQNVLYLIGPTGTGTDKYEEFVYTTNNEFIKIGDTTIDLSNYVQKDGNKQLSTEDFTTALLNKLNGIETGAQVNIKPDWNAVTGDSSEILNKPTIPTNVSDLTNDIGYITSADIPAQVNADWNAVSGAGQILNKPNISDEFVIELIGSYVNNNPVISSNITFEEMMEAYNNDKQLILKFNFTNSFFGVGSESTVYLKNFEYFELEVEDTPPPDYTYHMVIGVKFFAHVGASLLPNIFENIVLTEGNLIPNTETHSLNVSIDNIVFATSFILDTPKNATNGNVGINVMNYNSQTSDYDINNGGIIISGNNATSVITNSNGDIIVDTPVGDGLEITQNGLQPKVDGTTIEINSNGELSVIGGGSGGSGEGMVLELWGSSPNYGNVGQNLSIVVLRTRDDVYQWNESSDYGSNTTDSRIRDSILSKVLDIVYGKNLPVGTARPEILVKLGYTYYRGRTDVEPIEYVTNIISGRHITYASSYLYIIYQVENFTSSSANNLRGVSRAITFSYTKEEDRIWVNPT